MKTKYINNHKKYKPIKGKMYILHLQNGKGETNRFIISYSAKYDIPKINYAYNLDTDVILSNKHRHEELISDFKVITLHRKANIKERKLLEDKILIDILDSLVCN